MNKKVRIGLIGAGFMGGAHAECHRLNNLGELEIVADQSEERAKDMKDHFGFNRMTKNWKDVVRDPDVDLVDITVPNYAHKEIAIECAKEGKNFIVEKPLARSVKEADEIIEAVEEAGIKGMYAEDLRYAPQYVESKKVIDEGGVGEPFMIRSNEMHNGPFHSKWFWDAELAGGGVVIDVGIHGLYCVEWLMGARAVEVYARAGAFKWKEQCKNGAEDTALVSLSFDSGAIAELVFSWAISGGMDTRTEIFGTKGNIYIDSARTVGGLLIYSQDGYGEELNVEASKKPHVASKKGWSFPAVDVWNVHGHAQELRHFLRCVIDDQQPITTLEDGRRALELVEAVYKSARLGKSVKI